MIASIRGMLLAIGDGFAVVEAGGIGYRIFLPSLLLAQLPPTGKEVRFFTHMQCKEDGITLYGFGTQEELGLFGQLLSVSGVGPKAALSFLSALRPQEVITAIQTEDVHCLCTVPGIGKKTAQRILLELRDKCAPESTLALSFAASPPLSCAKSETAEALMALGYTRAEAASALRDAPEDMPAESLLKQALSKLLRS